MKEGQDEKSIKMSQLFLAQLALQKALIPSASMAPSCFVCLIGQRSMSSALLDPALMQLLHISTYRLRMAAISIVAGR